MRWRILPDAESLGRVGAGIRNVESAGSALDSPTFKTLGVAKRAPQQNATRRGGKRVVQSTTLSKAERG